MWKQRLDNGQFNFWQRQLVFFPERQKPFWRKNLDVLFHYLRESVLISNLEENLRLKILTKFSLRINFEVSPRQTHHIDDYDDGDDVESNYDGNDVDCNDDCDDDVD